MSSGNDATVFSARARPVVVPDWERTYAGESDDLTMIPERFAGDPGEAGGAPTGGMTIAGGLSFAVLAIAAMLVVALVMALAER